MWKLCMDHPILAVAVPETPAHVKWQRLLVQIVEKSAKYRLSQPKEGPCIVRIACQNTENPGSKYIIF